MWEAAPQNRYSLRLARSPFPGSDSPKGIIPFTFFEGRRERERGRRRGRKEGREEGGRGGGWRNNQYTGDIPPSLSPPSLPPSPFFQCPRHLCWYADSLGAVWAWLPLFLLCTLNHSLSLSLLLFFSLPLCLWASISVHCVSTSWNKHIHLSVSLSLSPSFLIVDLILFVGVHGCLLYRYIIKLCLLSYYRVLRSFSDC